MSKRLKMNGPMMCPSPFHFMEIVVLDKLLCKPYDMYIFDKTDQPKCKNKP